MLSKIKMVLSRLAMAMLSLMLAGVLVSSFMLQREVIRPLDAKDIQKVSAMIVMEQTMGSSTVVHSGPDGTDFLTNDHVCEDAKKSGALVVLDHNTYEATSIKESKRADLCLVHIKEDLRVTTQLAPKAPEMGDPILAGGYPLALSLIVQRGYLSDQINMSENPFKAEIGVLTSVLVQPGASGTGVFNADGELIAVLEAFHPNNKYDSMGFGIAVPYSAVKNFLEKEQHKLPPTPVPHVPRT